MLAANSLYVLLKIISAILFNSAVSVAATCCVLMSSAFLLSLCVVVPFLTARCSFAGVFLLSLSLYSMLNFILSQSLFMCCLLVFVYLLMLPDSWLLDAMG